MARDNLKDSRVTLASGRKGMMIGALAGGIGFALLAFIFDMAFGIGTGGPGLHFIAGAAVGGLAGTLIGAIGGSHRHRLAYHGPERRHGHSAYGGVNRRGSR